MLTAYLCKAGYDEQQISRAIYLLRVEADNHNRGLYENNKAVYNMLRYGVPVKIEAGKVTETVQLINWKAPLKNDFAIAQEVTLKGGHERRPDLVLYVNGIAVGIIELKNSRVSIGEGIRQSLSNQQPEFNQRFFSTIQLIFAGNDSEGLKYGSIETEEKYFLKWKEDEFDNSRFKLDKYLLKMCRQDRLLELVYDFVLFDGGVKKLSRVHQYIGIKKAQEHVRQRKGGIIWHTRGSGKSIVMVLLAKWILENNSSARVAIITDRDELDKQIKEVFQEAGETIARCKSGRETPFWLLPASTKPRSINKMTLSVRPGTDRAQRQEILERWYREQLRSEVPKLIARWEKHLGVKVERFFVQRMKTRWGSCNPSTASIRLNTDLAKKPVQCLEYIVVHEMMHLHEPTHNAHFIALMDRYMPKWEERRQLLNRLPVRHEDWEY